MASNWYLKDGDAESGPIPFRELVERARSETLSPGDLVRPEWNAEWQRADGVVGLFYMAQKSDEELQTLDAPLDSPPSTESVLTVETNQDAATEQRPGWMLRLLPLIRGAKQSDRKAAEPSAASAIKAASTENVVSEAANEPASVGVAAESPDLSPGDHAAAVGNQVWSDTLNAALTHADQRSTRNLRVSEAVRGSLFVRLRRTRFWLGCQLLLAMCCAGFVAERIHRISTDETSRLEQRARVLARQAASRARGRLRGETVLETEEHSIRQRYFPVIGQIEPSQYILMLAGISLATVVATYSAQRALDASVNRWLNGRWREAV